MKLPDELRFILESALLAPSADNHHRIRIEILAGAEVLIWHTGPAMAATGYKRVLTLLSLGAVAENLAIAARHHQRHAEIDVFPESQRPDLALHIRLKPTEIQEDPLWREIPSRHTNRHVLFHGPALSEAEKARLAQAAQLGETVRLAWLDAPALRRAALKLMRRAETERFRNPLLHEELFAAIRFDLGWHASCQEGLPPGALGVEAPLRPFFALLRHWPVMAAAKLVGAHHVLGWRACDLPCRFAPHVGLLAVEKVDNHSVILAGRAFQRIWLAATQLGRVIQPMPASALYALEGAQTEGVDEGLRHALREGWQALIPGKIPLMLFRMGRAESHATVTRRKALSLMLGTPLDPVE